MKLLKQAMVWRGGSSSAYRTRESTNVFVSSSRSKMRFDTKRCIEISFTIPSKGGGETSISIEIMPNEFGDLLDEMQECDRISTLKAASSIVISIIDEKAKEISGV
jgi:hypothetical protein